EGRAWTSEPQRGGLSAARENAERPQSVSDLTYYVAASLDGFIAQEDGSFGAFSWDEEVVADFVSDLERFGTVLMGRKTYEAGLNEGKTSPYPAMRQIVFSRTFKESPDPAVELVRGDLAAFVRGLKSESEAPIWLCGGGEVASTLLGAGLVDRMVVKLNPVVLGSGIPLFGSGVNATPLKLIETKVYGCGIVLLTYEVSRSGDPAA
ncbi:MAG: dihydrofolate reductase family protein, partial [Acidobacteriota bacterium]